MSKEEVVSGIVVNLIAVITLDVFYGRMEMSGNVGKKVYEGGEYVGLEPEWESPKKMHEIIQANEVIFESGDARNG